MTVPAAQPVQQQPGTGEGPQVEQRQDEDGKPGRCAADQRRERLTAGRDGPVVRRGGVPVLHGARHGVPEAGEHVGPDGVGVMPGDQHPAVGGVAERVGGAERRHERERHRRDEAGHQDGPCGDDPPVPHGAHGECQPGGPGGERGTGQRDRQVRGKVCAERPGRLTRPSWIGRFHDGRPGHGHREGQRDAQAGRREPGPPSEPGAPGVFRPLQEGRPQAHRRVARALATSASCRAR